LFETDVVTFVRQDQITGQLLQTGQLRIAAGSREHYFHFMLGYLLPLLSHVHQHENKYFKVLDCGPVMTPILVETLDRLGHDSNVVSVSEISNPHYLPMWDEGWSENEAPIVNDAIDKLESIWVDEPCNQGDCPTSRIILLHRSEAPTYYLDGSAETAGYGRSRREILNLPEVLDHLELLNLGAAIYEPGRHSLGCQIRTFCHAQVLIGIRGAEWANTIWCRLHPSLLVLDPLPPAHHLTTLLLRLPVNFSFRKIDGFRTVIDPSLVSDFIFETLSIDQSTDPQPPRPTRLD
jgi:Glycosyltransferase 61